MADVRAFGGQLTQAQVEFELDRLVGVMGERTDQLAELSMRASEAEVEFKRAYAIAYTQGGGPVKDREQIATLASLDALREFRRCAALEKSGQEALRTITRALDVLRTLSSNIRGQS